MKIVRNLTRFQKVFLIVFILIIWICFYKYQNNTQYQPSRRPLDKIIRYGLHRMDSINIVISSRPSVSGHDTRTTQVYGDSDKGTCSLYHLNGFHGCSATHMQNWPSHIRSRFSYEIRPIDYPGIANQDLNEWVYMFKACSTQRLFIPKMLPNVDSVLYIDADTLFLDDIRHLWEHFSKFNEYQIAGIAEEFYLPGQTFGPYQEGKPPLAGQRSGVNAGVILMNLTRMRDFGWQDRILPIYKKYGTSLYADQGIINVIFHDNLDKLYTLPCRWNYWDARCNYGNLCQSGEELGVGVLHHTGFNWFYDKDLHAAVYGPYLKYNFEDDMINYLVSPMKKELGHLKGVSKCGDNSQVFTKGLESAIKRLQG